MSLRQANAFYSECLEVNKQGCQNDFVKSKSAQEAAESHSRYIKKRCAGLIHLLWSLVPWEKQGEMTKKRLGVLKMCSLPSVQTVNKSVKVLTLQVLDTKFPHSCKKAFTRRVEKEREWILSSCFGTEEAQIPRMQLAHPLCLCSPSLFFSVC